MILTIIAIIISVIVIMALGALWYSPMMFGPMWSTLIGRSMKDLKGGANTGYLITTLTALVEVIALNYMMKFPNHQDIIHAVGLVIVIWLGFIVTAVIPEYVFSGKSYKLFLINYGYNFIGLLVTAIILGAFKYYLM